MTLKQQKLRLLGKMFELYTKSEFCGFLLSIRLEGKQRIRDDDGKVFIYDKKYMNKVDYNLCFKE